MSNSLKRLSSEERDKQVHKLKDRLASLATSNPEDRKKRVEINEEIRKIARNRKAYINAQSLDPSYILERQLYDEKKAAERQRKIDNGELIEGTAIYVPKVPKVISPKNSAIEMPGMSASQRAELEKMRKSNLERYYKTSQEFPGLFSSTRKALGRRHKKTKKSHKKRKTHKKRKSAHKKSRKH